MTLPKDGSELIDPFGSFVGGVKHLPIRYEPRAATG